MRPFFQFCALTMHYLTIWLAEKSEHWLFYYFHSMSLNLSFFVFTMFDNTQGNQEIYRMFEYKLMLYLGYLCMIYITSFNMSVSFISTTLGNIVSSIVINKFYQDSYGIEAMVLVKLNLMAITIIFFAAYNHEY